MHKKLVDELNLQIMYEFFSSHLYLAMASFANSRDFDGFESWFLVQREEEMFHAMKFYRYLLERGEGVTITGFENPKTDYESLTDALEYALNHEGFVTSRINHLMDVATEVKDYAAIQFLQWFINEQVEEEDSFRNLLGKVKMVGETGEGIYHIDLEAAKRVFNPPVAE